MEENMNNEKIFLVTLHHSDITWQFSYEKYDEIREEQLNIVLDFFSKYPDYVYILDQAYILENYISRNPKKADVIRKLVNRGEGRFELAGSYLIPDLNMCSGESFIRNCIMGLEYYQKEFGTTPKVASLMDAFGMPMQVPQILSKLGYSHLIPGRMPNMPKDMNPDESFIWKGMGETELMVVQNTAGVDKSSHETNVPVLYNADQRFEKTLTDLQNMNGNVLAFYMTEIQMLDEIFFKHLEKINSNPDANRQITFGRFSDYCKTIDKNSLYIYQGEFNPTLTGCYTTRIGVKQKIRKAENLIFATEMAAVCSGKTVDLSEAWKELILAQFHDGACGCHHDICNIDVIEKLNFAINAATKEYEKILGSTDGNKLLIINPSAYSEERIIESSVNAVPVGVTAQKDGSNVYFSTKLKAHSLCKMEIDNNNEPVVPVKQCAKDYKGQTEYFTFDFSEVSPKIKSKRFPDSVFGQTNFAEVQFRHECGSMWDEVYKEPPFGAEYQEETVSNVEEGPVFIKVTTNGYVVPGKKPISGNSGMYWTGFSSLMFTKEYIFPLNQPYFKLRLTLDFVGSNTKISLRIPVELNPLKSKALYDTPFAASERKPYFEVPFEYEASMQPLTRNSDYLHANGDFPALHWVDYRDENKGLAVANSGTPGHQLVGKDIIISLIRSGTRCMDGTMYPQPGVMDNGTHVFEFAFSEHTANEPEKASWLGSVINRNPICLATDSQIVSDESIVVFGSDNIIVSSVFFQNGNIIIRAYESFGTETKTTMITPKNMACFNADMKGFITDKLEIESTLFTPYEIKTFVLMADSKPN